MVERKPSSQRHLPALGAAGRAHPPARSARGSARSLGLGVLALIVLFGVRERQRTGERATRAALLVTRRAVDSYRADHDGKCPHS